MLLLPSRFLYLASLVVMPLVSQAATITFSDMRADREAAAGNLLKEENFANGPGNAPGRRAPIHAGHAQPS